MVKTFLTKIYHRFPIFLKSSKISKIFRHVIYVKEVQNWEELAPFKKGYSKSEIYNKVLKSALKAKEDESFFERDSVILKRATIDWELIAFLFLSAASNKGKLECIDVGGSLGSTYFENLPQIKQLKYVEWTIVEQKGFVELGNKYLADDSLSFYTDLGETLKLKNYNMAFFGSSLQYLRDYKQLLRLIISSNIKYLVIDRTPTFMRSTHGIFLQKVPSHIYEAEYPSYVFSKTLLIAELEQNWNIYSLGAFEASRVFTCHKEPVEWTRIFATKK